jgi:hypothetical protein
MDHLVAVSEHLRYDRSGHLADELLQGSVSSTEKVDTEATQPIHHGVGVKMLAGPVSRE